MLILPSKTENKLKVLTLRWLSLYYAQGTPMKTFLTLSITGVLIALIGWAIFANGQNKNVTNNDSQLSSFNQPETIQPSTANNENLPENMNQNNQLAKPTMQLDQQKNYQAILETDLGTITIDLFASLTPITVNNFVYLVNQGFYDGTIFHRTINGFMIQGGDPTGTGSGGPGYKFDDEPFEGNYERGIVAMANSGPNTNGSQFFIMHQDNEQMPRDYVIFGQVIQGLNVVDKIATAPTTTSQSGENSKPITPVKINTATINQLEITPSQP